MPLGVPLVVDEESLLITFLFRLSARVAVEIPDITLASTKAGRTISYITLHLFGICNKRGRSYLGKLRENLDDMAYLND